MTGAKDTSEPAPPSTAQDSPGTELPPARTRLRERFPGNPRLVEDDGADVPEDTQDHWLDEVTVEEQESGRSLYGRITDTFIVPVLWLRRIFKIGRAHV